MKKILLSALAVIVAAATGLAATFSNSYQLSGFTGIRASNSFHVEVIPSTSFSVRIEAPDYIEPYLIVEANRDQLTLGLKQLPRAIERKLSNERPGALYAEVKMPRLQSVSLSGAAVLEALGDFPDLRGRTFQLDMSGASRARGLSVSTSSATISMSGASDAGLTGRIGEVRIDISGATRLNLGIETSSLKAELSGSSRLDVDGRIEEARLQASGAARIGLQTLVPLSSLRIQGSGASVFDCRSAKAQDVTVGLSGASNCKVSALRRIEVEASGASSCSYEAGPDLDLDIIQVSRGASLRKL